MNNTDTFPIGFNFSKYKLKEFVFTIPNYEPSEVELAFTPTGIYNQEKGIFVLTTSLIANYPETQQEFAKVILDGFFEFPTKTTWEEIPEFFFDNSIAILYPYIRAFMSTVTAIAGMKLLTIPTYRFVGMGDQLKQNTVIE